MNIALEQTEEYVNGQLKNKYGDAFIRGNNGKPIIHCTKAYTPLPPILCSIVHQHNTKKMNSLVNHQYTHQNFMCFCVY